MVQYGAGPTTVMPVGLDVYLVYVFTKIDVIS